MLGGGPLQDLQNAGTAEVKVDSQVKVPELLAEAYNLPWPTTFNASSEQLDGLFFEALLPGFASIHVREMQACIQQLLQQLEQINKELSGHKQRIGIISEHRKVVHLELNFAESKSDALGLCLQNETRLKILREHEKVQLQQAQKSHDTASRCTAELFLTLKVQHVGNTGKISKLKSSLRWTERQSEQWLQCCREREENIFQSEIVQHVSNACMKALYEGSLRAMTNTSAAEERLEVETAQATDADLHVKSALEAFMRLHHEGQATAAKREHSLAALERREGAIIFVEHKCTLMQTQLESYQGNLDMAMKVLKGHQYRQGVAETELMGTLSLLGRSKAARVWKEQELEGSLNELERLKNTLIASTRELAGSRAANDATRHIMVCQQTQLLYLQNEAAATRQACMDEAEKGVSCEAATRALEICLMAEKASQRTAERQLDDIHAKWTESKQQLQIASTQECMHRSAVTGILAASQNCHQDFQYIVKKAARLCEMHYRLDFRLLMLRRQLLRATGFLPEDNMAALHSNVAELSLKKRDITQDNLQLVKNIEQGMLQLGAQCKSSAKLQLHKVLVTDAVSSLDGKTESTLCRLQYELQGRRARFVDRDLVASGMRRLCVALSHQANILHAAQQQQNMLEVLLHGILCKLQVKKELLHMDVQYQRGEMHTAVKELTLQHCRAKKMKRKCEIQQSKQITHDGHTGSQANYIDNATKQKQELLQRHKGLLSATVQAEMVVSGLQEALKEMCISNKGVSHSFRDVKVDQLKQQQLNTRGSLSISVQILQQCKSRCQGLGLQIREGNARLKRLEAVGEEIKRQSLSIAWQKVKSEVQFRLQGDKRSRADKHLAASKRALLEGAHRRVSDLGTLAKEVELRNIQDANTSILHDVAAQVEKHPEAQIGGALAESGIALPARHSTLKVPNARVDSHPPSTEVHF